MSECDRVVSCDDVSDVNDDFANEESDELDEHPAKVAIIASAPMIDNTFVFFMIISPLNYFCYSNYFSNEVYFYVVGKRNIRVFLIK